MVDEKLKEKVLDELFPFAIQAVYNAYKTLGYELSGEWWQLPDHTLTATREDCCLVLDILKYCGFKTPQYMNKTNLVHIERDQARKCMGLFVWEHMTIEERIENRAQDLCNLMVKQKIKEYKERISQNGAFSKMDIFVRQRLIEIRNQIKKDYEEKFQEKAEAYSAEKIAQIREQNNQELACLREELEEGYKNQEKIVAKLVEKIQRAEKLEKIFYEFSSLYQDLIPDKKTLDKIKTLFKRIQCEFRRLKAS